MKRFGGLVAAVTVAGCLMQGCSGGSAGGKKGLVIGVSLLNVSNEFIVMLNRAMDAKAKELGVELIVNDAQRSAERQVQQARFDTLKEAVDRIQAQIRERGGNSLASAAIAVADELARRLES